MTLKQIIEDPQKLSNDMSLMSQTKELEFQTITIESGMKITLVYTPGLFDRSSNQIDTQTIHGEIQKIIDTYVSIASGINSEDVKAIENFLDYFGPELAKHMFIIVTRCQSKNKQQRQTLRLEIEQDTYFRSIAASLTKGIHFSGALKRDDWNHANEALLVQFRNICDYRHELIQLLQ
ncbi:hypothetical protein I4U23_015070 [Adineta vaga]|nr:hypothetical protein I4U23_015070 [Adineta vaga]